MKQGFYQVPRERSNKEIRSLLNKLSEENKKLINEIKSLEVKDKTLSHLSNEIEKELSKKCHELEKNQDTIAELQEHLLKIDQAQNEKYRRESLSQLSMSSPTQSETDEIPYDLIPTYSREAFFPYGRLILERMSKRANEASSVDPLNRIEKDSFQDKSKSSEDNKNYIQVIDFIKRSNELLKEELVHFAHSKESQQKVNVLQEAIAILSSSETPKNKLHNFYTKIGENRNLFKKRFNLGSEIKKSLILSSYLNPAEPHKNSEEFFGTYKKLLQKGSSKEENFIDLIDEERINQGLKI